MNLAEIEEKMFCVAQ
jgi:hypothetical protein